MNYKLIANYIGNILRIEGLFMIPALLVSLYHNEFKCVLAFGISIAALLVIGQLMHMIKPQKQVTLNSILKLNYVKQLHYLLVNKIMDLK